MKTLVKRRFLKYNQQKLRLKHQLKYLRSLPQMQEMKILLMKLRQKL
jgi:hypothetical protein